MFTFIVTARRNEFFFRIRKNVKIEQLSSLLLIKPLRTDMKGQNGGKTSRIYNSFSCTDGYNRNETRDMHSKREVNQDCNFSAVLTCCLMSSVFGRTISLFVSLDALCCYVG